MEKIIVLLKINKVIFGMGAYDFATREILWKIQNYFEINKILNCIYLPFDVIN
jgi:hypothetical protein